MTLVVRLSLVALLLTACNREGDINYMGDVSDVTEIVKPGEKGAGAIIPDFKWQDRNGLVKSFREVADGNLVIVNFWATWCLPCKMTLVALREINKKYADKNVVVIGISTLDPTDPAYRLPYISKFVEERGFGYQVLLDTDEKVMWSAFGMEEGGGVPTMVFVKDNKIVKAFSGSQTEESLKVEIEKLSN